MVWGSRLYWSQQVKRFIACFFFSTCACKLCRSEGLVDVVRLNASSGTSLENPLLEKGYTGKALRNFS